MSTAPTDSSDLPAEEENENRVRSLNTASPLPEPPPPLVEVHKPLRATAWLWRLIPLMALTEIAQHCVIQNRLVAETDWQRAAEYYRAHASERDGVLIVPEWADPNLRRYLGEGIDVARSAPSDGAKFSALWVFSMRGYRLSESPRYNDYADSFAETPAEEVRFGRLIVYRFARRPDARRVEYEFLPHHADAQVFLHEGASPIACPLTNLPWSGGGLGGGPAAESMRHVCDRGRPWLFVGPVVLNDLQLLPRHCLWQHPQGTAPVETIFPDVPLTRHMRFYAGIHYENERDRDKGDVLFRVQIAGETVGSMVHRDGDGWKSFDVEVPPQWVGTRQSVSLSTTTDAPYLRTFCWNGYTYSHATETP